jgi:hypothetical protein
MSEMAFYSSALGEDDMTGETTCEGGSRGNAGQA